MLIIHLSLCHSEETIFQRENLHLGTDHFSFSPFPSYIPCTCVYRVDASVRSASHGCDRPYEEKCDEDGLWGLLDKEDSVSTQWYKMHPMLMFDPKNTRSFDPRWFHTNA